MTTHTSINWTSVRERLQNSEQSLEAALHPSGQTLRQVLHRRAEKLALPRVKEEVAGQDGTQLLVFRLGEDRFALDLADVGEVSPLRKCTPVPGAPAELAGIICHRGEMRCVIDLARLLGRQTVGSSTENDGRSRSSYLLHIRRRGAPGAGSEVRLRVDGVDEALSVLAGDLLTTETAQDQPLGRFVKAVHRSGITVLSTQAVCDPSSVRGSSHK